MTPRNKLVTVEVNNYFIAFLELWLKLDRNDQVTFTSEIGLVMHRIFYDQRAIPFYRLGECSSRCLLLDCRYGGYFTYINFFCFVRRHI